MKINVKAIKKKLQGVDILSFDVIDSTNSEAKRRVATKPKNPLLILAGEQTSGRGRMGRSFYSGGDGIYMTYVQKINAPLGDVVTVTVASAKFVSDVLCELCGGDFKIKWVNDIYLDGGKVCGILTETVTGSDGEIYVIVGIGINIGKSEFPSEIRDIAVSVKTDVKPHKIICAVVEKLKEYLTDPESVEYIKTYRSRLLFVGDRVSATYGGREICGIMEGVDDDGALLLTPDGESEAIRIFSGEVSVRAKES